MAFSRPTLNGLIERINTDLASRVVGRSAILRRSVLGVLARVLGGASHLLHGHLDYNARQVLPDTADAEHLERWSSIWGVGRTPASFARGNARVSGSEGGVIAAGVILQRDDGAEYITTAEATITDGSALLPLEASAAGLDGNLDPGVTLAFLSPIAGIESSATVDDAGITGGTDVETDPRLLERLLKRMQEPPHGGADFDYEQWALAQPGVTRAWVYPRYLGAGTVGVTFVCDDLDPIIPDEARVASMQSALDEVRPVTAEVVAFASAADPLDFVIAGLTPGTQAVRDAVAAELADLITREAEPGGTILISHIREAISIAAGENDHRLISPCANVTHGNGRMPIMGTISWQ
ncbi:baseplate J/gp47 family protein [Salinicola avicenniae]|uniref:baseplate J/gp47 family protein n=1 Tax=Salinicola avicenniae TaxID=2916836 RepID=UPI002073445A|nr:MULTISPECIES: baseplate J/gp47 family protein [unclassified Salinicola]